MLWYEHWFLALYGLRQGMREGCEETHRAQPSTQQVVSFALNSVNGVLRRTRKTVPLSGTPAPLSCAS